MTHKFLAVKLLIITLLTNQQHSPVPCHSLICHKIFKSCKVCQSHCCQVSILLFYWMVQIPQQIPQLFMVISCQNAKQSTKLCKNIYIVKRSQIHVEFYPLPIALVITFTFFFVIDVTFYDLHYSANLQDLTQVYSCVSLQLLLNNFFTDFLRIKIMNSSIQFLKSVSNCKAFHSCTHKYSCLPHHRFFCF